MDVKDILPHPGSDQAFSLDDDGRGVQYMPHAHDHALPLLPQIHTSDRNPPEQLKVWVEMKRDNMLINTKGSKKSIHPILGQLFPPQHLG